MPTFFFFAKIGQSFCSLQKTMWFGCDVHIFLFAFVLFKKRQEIEQKVMAEKPTNMKETTMYSYPFSMMAYWMLGQ